MPTPLPHFDPSGDFAAWREKAVAMNEALILGAVRQHELTDAAEDLNVQLQETARELAEKARLLDLSNDAIIVRDFDDLITSWNKGAEKLYGWTCDEVLGRDLHSFLCMDFPRPKEEILAQLDRDGHFTGEVAQFARDGRRISAICRWVLDRGTRSILTSYTDITERKRAEEALRASEEFNRSIVESNRDCLKVLDLEGRLLMMAPAGQELLCIGDIGPYLGKSWIDFFEGADRDEARAAIATAVAGETGHFAGFFRTLRGEGKWWDVVISPIRDARGKTERLLAISRDVTERRSFEDSLVARADDLAQADRAKDEFLAMLAHELRNPLAPMRNAAEIMRAEGASGEERRHAQAIIARQIENMTRMIDDLLDVSRITEGKIEMRPRVVALADILTAAVSVARSGIEARGQELAVALPAEPVFLNADATRLEQVFGNLLGNACKYSDAGCHIGLSAEVAPVAGSFSSSSSKRKRIEDEDEDDYEQERKRQVIVRVRDDGMGIAPEVLPHIFDLFVQATRALDRAHGGLGIGLTLVNRLVTLHGGSVEARSEGLGHGSEFIVHLPILASQAIVPKAPPPPAVRDTPRRMLIVDDNEDSARSMATLQRLRGHETRTAFTGPDAVAAAAEFLPNVVLLDIGLPGMDGCEVAIHLRSMPALTGAFLVAMSGYGSPADIARAKAAGFDEYLVKPADLELLRAWLRGRA